MVAMSSPVRTSTRTLKDFGARKVLIIDDDQDLLMSFKDYFEMEAYQVLTARNGKEALDLLATVDEMELPDAYLEKPLSIDQIRNLSLHFIHKRQEAPSGFLV